MEEIANNQRIDLDSNTFQRQFMMSEAEYDHIAEMNERGEEVEFEIPKDAPQGRRYSDIAMERAVEQEDDSDLVPVDMADEFGGDLSGG